MKLPVSSDLGSGADIHEQAKGSLEEFSKESTKEVSERCNSAGEIAVVYARKML